MLIIDKVPEGYGAQISYSHIFSAACLWSVGLFTIVKIREGVGQTLSRRGRVFRV